MKGIAKMKIPTSKIDKKQLAREYAAKINHSMADHALDADRGFASHVTHQDKIAYQKRQREYANEIEAGKHDHNFTIWQRMNYFLTGESVAFLPS